MAVGDMAAAPPPAAGGPSPIGVPWGDAAAMGVDLRPIQEAAGRLRAQVDAGKLPGCLTCVSKDGKLLHLDAHGLADVPGRLPLDGDTLFRLYSQTKPITVVGFLRLLERGLAGLDDPVYKYIPSFRDVKVGDKRKPLHRPILIRDLLAHTSGVGFGPGFFEPAENDYERTYVEVVGKVDRGEVRTLAAWCEEIARLPLRFQPGKDWGYGYSSDLLGRIAEVVSGSPLDELLRREVLEPLGMVDTSFAVPAAKAATRLAALCKREPWDGNAKHVKLVTVDPGGSGLTEDAARPRKVLARGSDNVGPAAPSSSVFLEGAANHLLQGGGCVCSVAGGLLSTIRDYIRLGTFLLNWGELDGVRLLKPESVGLLAKDWLNDFSTEKRKKPLWVWDTVGIGFSPLGQIGIEHPSAKGVRRGVGAQLHTVHWGGAGGSGYMLNWPHRVLVLTYTGCTFDTATQKALWRAAFAALRKGGARPLPSPEPGLAESPAAAGAASSADDLSPLKRRPASADDASPMKRPAGATKASSSDDDSPSKRRKVLPRPAGVSPGTGGA